MKLKLYVLIILFVSFLVSTSRAEDVFNFKLTYETEKLTDSPFFLITAGDINGNGAMELVVADFGKYGDHLGELTRERKNPSLYKLFILEWASGKLKTNFKKEWDMSNVPESLDSHRYFLAYEANQMVAWKIGNKTVVETIPPYLGIEWGRGEYILHEQQGPFNSGPLVGSWVFPWLSPSCYQGFSSIPTWPRECLIGVRNFSGRGFPKLISISEDQIVKDKQYKQILQVRKMEPGFPIEWKMGILERFTFDDPIDKYNISSKSAILLREYRTVNWYLLEKLNIDAQYALRELAISGSRGIEIYDLPDIYLRSSQKRGVEEYWGYYFKESKDGGKIPMPRKITLSPDLTRFIRKDIDFQHKPNFIGIGYFDLKDIDNDGLDEIILVEETGKRKFYTESIEYSNTKDYIRILKWDGKKYRTMWVSPPYKKQGTKFLVEDIKNTGKKQLIVMTSYGTIQIWERK